MAVNVSTVDNTTRACVDARADGPDGVRPDSSSSDAVGLADESGLELEFASGVAGVDDDGGTTPAVDPDPDRYSALECARAVDGVDPAARIGNRSRRPAMITALSPSVSRQDRPLPATGVATNTDAGSDTSTTDTDTAAIDGTDRSTAVLEADDGASTLAATGTDTGTATGDGTVTTATRRPSHSSIR